ncbi:MAG: glutamate--tRNA ligase [Halobacteriaceae archaeon]
MDDDLEARVREAAEIAALENAVRHGTDAQVDAIMGPLMADHPQFRPHADAIPGVIAPVVESVNDLDPSERRDRLAAIAPERLEAIEREAEAESEDQGLPDLPNVEAVDEVRLRMAPNPNGPWHLGSARMGAVIGRYAERYDGSFICRFDDTDPETKRPDLSAYDAILEDVAYLGFEPDEVVYASDRLETYYEHARALIDAGGAYTCSCPAEDFSERKAAGEPCPHRDKDVDTVHEEFDGMVADAYDPGEMVLRVRTDIEHKNPALRDWVAFRMVGRDHPRPAAAGYRCWPMLDFQSGIDDHLTGVTHIIRGIDLQDSAKRQQFVYDYFDWEYPEVLHWGHVQVDAYDVPMSTSSIADLITAGELDGWDDPRAPTIRSLRRRGIRGTAIVEAMADLGLSTSDVSLSMSSVYAYNRELIDDTADRRFLVRDGVRRQIVGGPDAGHPPRHPDHPDRGDRELSVAGGVLIEPEDLPSHGDRVWLKGYGCVRVTRDALEYTGDDIDVVRSGPVDVVHWVPAADGVPVQLRTPDGDVDGIAEPGLTDHAVDDVIQFERVGFARIDAQDHDPVVCYYAHP